MPSGGCLKPFRRSQRRFLSNQQIAESIAARLRQSGVLQRYDVDIRFRDGAAELTGSVADAVKRKVVGDLLAAFYDPDADPCLRVWLFRTLLLADQTQWERDHPEQAG